jgi:hypothetical protein
MGPEFEVGDLVRRGKGKTVYRITGFWNAPSGESMASLEPLVGYTSASAPLDALTAVPGE